VYTGELSESLLKAPQGGPFAVWASSGLNPKDEQVQLGEDFTKMVLSGSATIGEAPPGQGLTRGARCPATWNLLGDPSMSIGARRPHRRNRRMERPRKIQEKTEPAANADRRRSRDHAAEPAGTSPGKPLLSGRCFVLIAAFRRTQSATVRVQGGQATSRPSHRVFFLPAAS